jgi:hypothetical protein
MSRRVQNPILFSTYFHVDSASLNSAGLIDPFVDVDILLFLDPILLEKSLERTNTNCWDRRISESFFQ